MFSDFGLCLIIVPLFRWPTSGGVTSRTRSDCLSVCLYVFLGRGIQLVPSNFQIKSEICMIFSNKTQRSQKLNPTEIKINQKLSKKCEIVKKSNQKNQKDISSTMKISPYLSSFSKGISHLTD